MTIPVTSSLECVRAQVGFKKLLLWNCTAWERKGCKETVKVKEAQTVLFLRKLPHHIRNLINPWAFKQPEDLIQRCNKIWEDQTIEEAAAVATPRPHSPYRGARRSLSPFHGKRSGGNKSGRCRSPTLGPTRGSHNDHLCFYHSRFSNKAQKCKKGCSYQEN
jgi:hypothetical protein